MAQENQVKDISLRWAFVGWEPQHMEGVKDWLIDKFLKHQEDWIIQVEKAPTTGTLHIQGWVKLETKKRPKSLAAELNHELFGIELSAASNEGRKALRDYAMKKDTRISGPWGKDQAKLEKQLRAKETPGYEGKDLPRHDQILPWQKNLIAGLAKEPHPRKIMWFMDTNGRSGKSSLIKYILYHYPNLRACFLDYSKNNDMLNLVKNACDQKMNRVFLFNLTRTKPADLQSDDLYAGLEAIKDGHVNNKKYETAALMFDKPHVVVFANEAPAQGKLTKDKLHVIDMSGWDAPAVDTAADEMYDDWANAIVTSAKQ